ncbi:hypothetical protein [Nonomuraea sp. CA-141351]|uniref:hypothetical protein n=1 Tax=Nonomuraea sp. CA-141351 TaxID=3239996 RepID=UPI003D8A063A
MARQRGRLDEAESLPRKGLDRVRDVAGDPGIALGREAAEAAKSRGATLPLDNHLAECG